jgi:hypothetical protein
MKKSTWDPRANRYERMKAAWVDVMRSGTSRLPFAIFEERMLERDLKQKKEQFIKNRLSPNWKVIQRALVETR